MMLMAVIILFAYLWAAIPVAYLGARFLKGIDIRDYGSGNVGASNFVAHVGKLRGFCLGLFDCVGKGVIPVLAVKFLDQGLAVQAVVGVAVIAGHNWSPYIRFTGGRGVATAFGVLLGLLMWQEILILTVIFVGMGMLVARDTAFWAFICMLMLPVLAYAYGEPDQILYMSFGVVLLLILKRLTANWETPKGQYKLSHVLALRLLWDRDVSRKSDWTFRKPNSENRG